MNAMASLIQRFRWSNVLLLVSLALNIFLVAYIGGQWAGSHKTGLLRLGPHRLVERLAKRLPTADAALLRNAYHSREAAITAVNKDYAEAIRHVLKVMAKPQLDPSALRKAVATVREHRRRMDDLVADMLLAAIEKMPPETRAALAKSPSPSYAR
jgi:uncharacterized membrane protein